MREEIIDVVCGRVWRRDPHGTDLVSRIKNRSVDLIQTGYSQNHKIDRHWVAKLAEAVGVLPNCIGKYIHGAFVPSTAHPGYDRKLPGLPVALGILKILDSKEFQEIEKSVEPKRKSSEPKENKRSPSLIPAQTRFNIRLLGMVVDLRFKLDELEKSVQELKAPRGLISTLYNHIGRHNSEINELRVIAGLMTKEEALRKLD